MKRKMYVLRRPATAYGPAAYYPPGAAVRAQWTTSEEAKRHRDGLNDASAWHAMPTYEARGLDRRDARAARDAEIRRILQDEAAQHGKREVDETPGDLMVYWVRRNGESLRVPVVAVRRIEEGPTAGTVVKMPDGAITHLPPEWGLEEESLDAWTEHLAKWRAGGFSYTQKEGVS